MLLDALRRFSASVNQPRLFLAKNRVAGPSGGAIVILIALQRCSASTSVAHNAVTPIPDYCYVANVSRSRRFLAQKKKGLAEPRNGTTLLAPVPTSEISS